MKFKYKGKTYPEFNSDDMTTDQAELIETYTGLRFSEAMNPEALGSDIKVMKIQLWHILAHAGENPPPLEEFGYRLGDLELVLTAKEKKDLAAQIKGDEPDPTTDPQAMDDENPPGESNP